MQPPQNAPTLPELQRWMAAQILGVGCRSTLAGESAKFDDFISPAGRGDIADRLHVYVAGYPARLQDALAETFPALAHIVGEAAFADFVQRYAEATPLRSYNLNDAGAEVPRFLRQDPLTQSLPFLPGLAVLEQQVARAFHAYELAAFDPTVVAAWGLEEWAGALLHFQPSVALVRSEWPIREIWEARETPIEEIDIDLRNRDDRVLVRRCGDAVICDSVDEAEAGALESLLSGGTLGSVAVDLAARGGDPAAVTAWFAGWIAAGMLVECSLQNTVTPNRPGE